MKYGRGASSDRNKEHARLFDNYRILPEKLGHLLEVGCGPFTQTRTILRGRHAQSITLMDPLLDVYTQHPNCGYPHIRPQPTLLTMKAEDLDYHAAFDTIICVNVLEHVQDAVKVLNNIRAACKTGSIIIMGERTYDEFETTRQYDVGHPIRVKRQILEDFKGDMQVVYSNGDYFVARVD